jgi:hypothetical protein
MATSNTDNVNDEVSVKDEPDVQEHQGQGVLAELTMMRVSQFLSQAYCQKMMMSYVQKQLATQTRQVAELRRTVGRLQSTGSTDQQVVDLTGDDSD